MSFSPKTWTSGQKIGADDLNRLENKVEEIRQVYDNVFDLDHLPSWKQVAQMLTNNIIPAIYMPNWNCFIYITYFSIDNTSKSSSNITYNYYDNCGQAFFFSNLEDGPVYFEEGGGSVSEK